MIDASQLVAAHLAAQEKPILGPDAARADEPAPRQYPLAGKVQARPLADPARRNTESKA